MVKSDQEALARNLFTDNKLISEIELLNYNTEKERWAVPTEREGWGRLHVVPGGGRDELLPLDMAALEHRTSLASPAEVQMLNYCSLLCPLPISPSSVVSECTSTSSNSDKNSDD